MAKKASVTLEVLLKSSGIKATTKQVEKLQSELKKLAGVKDANTKATGKASQANKEYSKTAGEAYRNARGTAEATGRANKDFGRMAQGMGGLVQAYATVAANVFALSSAFLVLRRAADLSSMIKSAEDYSNRFGRSVTRITKSMQEATGGALSFSEALPTINKAIATGISTEKIEQLSVAATKAAQTFGGSTNEALNRFISAAQRGRVEIIQTLGIVIKTEQAYEDYAASVGKTARELSAFDKQQAIINATIKESQNVFDGVNIDPNPFQRLLTTVIDLKDEFSTFATDALTPWLNKINESKAAALALMAIIVSSVAGRIFPALGDQIEEMQKKSIASTKRAKIAVVGANVAITKSILENGVQQNKLTTQQLVGRTKLFKSFYSESLSNHKSFKKNLMDENKKFNAGVINEQRAAITRELNIRSGAKPGKRSAAFRGINTKALINYRNTLILLTRETENARAATDKLTQAESAHLGIIKTKTTALSQAYTKMRATSIVLKSEFTTGFSKSFASAQTNYVVGVRAMSREWGRFMNTLISGSRSGQTAMMALGRAAGRTAGMIAGSVTKLIAGISSMLIYISLAKLAWDKFGDSIRGITPAQRAFIDGQEELSDALQEGSNRTKEYIKKVGEEIPSSLKNLSNALEFTAGTFSTIEDALVAYKRQADDALGETSVNGARLRLINLNKTLKDLKAQAKDEGSQIIGNIYAEDQYNRTLAKIRDTKKEIKNLRSGLTELASTDLEPLVKSITEATKAATISGFDEQYLSDKVQSGFTKAFGDLDVELDQAQLTTLTDAFFTGDAAQVETALSKIGTESGITAEKFEALSSGALNLVRSLFSAAGSASSAIKNIQDLDNTTSNYFKNAERALLSAGKNKEFVSLIYNIRNGLEELANVEGNARIDELLGDPEELKKVKVLLGLANRENLTANDLREEAARKLGVIFSATKEIVKEENNIAVAKVRIAAENAKVIKSNRQRQDQLKNVLNEELKIKQATKAKSEQQIKLAEEELKTAEATAKAAEGTNAEETAQIALQSAIFKLDLLKEEDILAQKIVDSTKEQNVISNALLLIEQKRKQAQSDLNVLQSQGTLLKEKLIRSDAEALSNLKATNVNLRQQKAQEIALLKSKLDNLNTTHQVAEEREQERQELEKLIVVERQRLSNLRETGDISERLLKLTQLNEGVVTELGIAQQAAKVAADQIVTSDAQRISKLGEQKSLQEKILALEITKLRIAAAKIIADGIQGDEQKRQLALITAQIEASEQIYANTKARNALQKQAEPVKVDKEVLENDIQILKVEKEIQDLRAQQSFSTKNQTIYAKAVLDNLDAQYSKQLQKLEVEKELVSILETNSDLEERKLELLDAQISKLQEKYKLEREVAALNSKARDLELAGEVFSKESIDVAMDYFRLKARKAAQEIEPIFKTIGDGFYDTITNTFETAIDNLLEGGKDFGETVREAFKAGLREMISQTLINDLKKIFSDAAGSILKSIDQIKLPEGKKESQKENQDNLLKSIAELKANQGDIPAQDAANRYTVNYLPLIYTELQALNLKPTTFSTTSPITSSAPFAPATPSIVNQFQTSTTLGGAGPVMGGMEEDSTAKAIESAFGSLKKTFSSVLDVEVKDPIEIGSGKVDEVSNAPGTAAVLGGVGALIAASQGDSKTAIISTLFTIASQIIASNVGGSVSVAAMGGIMTGRSTKLTPLASGGVVTRPMAALIGEGKNNEAVVPLPNNREIPVDLNGATGDTINIEQNFDFTNADASAISQLRVEARNIEERTFNRVFTEINKGGRYAKIVGRR